MSAALNDLTSAPGVGSGSPTVSQAAVGYFVDQKKGEVNELKTLLKNINVERDVKKKRETIKKVIAYMTLGIDVSRLFTDMIMAIETKDIVIKKMVYLYLCNYAHKEPEMAIMCINSLRRDCDNENPLIRGLALRSLCNLRLESILEYVQQPLHKSLNDISAYVRKTAVLGILKLNSLSPTVVETNGYIAQLHHMLQDADANVVSNVIHALNELQLSEGGLAASQPLVMGLLNRIVEFSEWGLNAVLDLVARYKPTSEDEVFAVMNLLDPLLRTANSGAVLATVKCFFRLTAAMPELHPQIFTRAKPPMLTLVNGASPEGQYAMLKHLQVILQQPSAVGIFDDEYRQFFVRYNEPPHVKHLKTELLPWIANETNARDIAAELGEYVTDVDSELAKCAIRSLGRIAVRILAVAQEMTQTIVDLVDMDSAYVRSQAAIVLADIVRIHPAAVHLVLPHICRWMRKVEDPAAKAAIIWVLGEFGSTVIEAPYLLETCIDSYEEEASTEIKLHLLTAALKLFFRRPPEMQKMLGSLLKRAINDASNQDVHDRALLYYRLLTTDVNICRNLFLAGGAASHYPTSEGEGVLCSVSDGQFAESKEDDLRRKLFDEFNSLAVIYKMPSVMFVKEKYQLMLDNAPLSDFDVAAPLSGILAAAAPAPEVDYPGSMEMAPPLPAATVAAAGSSLVMGSVNLLDWSDEQPSGPAASSSSQRAPRLLLKDLSAAGISAQRFQQLWSELPEAFNGKICSLASAASASITEYEAILREEKVAIVASGPIPGTQGAKLFVYACELEDLLVSREGSQFLAQVVITCSPPADREVTLILKHTPSPHLSWRSFADLLLLALSQYSPIQTY